MSSMQKTDRTNYSLFLACEDIGLVWSSLVWKKKFCLWVWSEGRNRQQFSCVWGHFAWCNKQPNTQLGDPRTSLPLSFAINKKSRNGDTLGPVELNIWPKKANQGDQGEVSIIILRMSKSSGFQKYSICLVFQALCLCLCCCRCLCHCLCLCICVLLWFLNSFHHKLSEYLWL